jgi:Skp family chaperone for outer membrane proteins
MKTIALAFAVALLLCSNATAAIKIDNHQAKNMDDVMSLGVIYINHNFATEQEAEVAINDDADQHGAKYYHTILMREPGSNGNMHVSADIYR